MQAMPESRGPLSDFLIALLSGAPVGFRPAPSGETDPEDLHLALYLCYELHYLGLEGVDARWEWEPSLLEFRRILESCFEAELREVAPAEAIASYEVEDRLKEISVRESPRSLSKYIAGEATLEQFREFVAHRSLYHLKEADPHSWAIPRLEGPPKAALIEIQADEYGGGRYPWMHSRLFAKLMEEVGLEPGYGTYLDSVPGITLATVNLISMFGLHRRWRGALVGHLALFEMTSSGPNRLYGDGLRRLGFGSEATHFYDEHVEADSLHEAIAAHDLAGGLAVRDAALSADIIFGAECLAALDARFAAHCLSRWDAGGSSLRASLEVSGQIAAGPTLP